MKSILSLKTEVYKDRTRISDMFFTPPYKIMSPFVKGKHIDIMQMCASAGLLGADQVSMDFWIGEGSDVTYLSQSYEKVFDTKGKEVQKNLIMHVEPDAKVKYFPYPVIPFENSQYHAENEIRVSKDATLVYSDIFTCGRVGMGEEFKMKSYRSKTRIYIEDQLVFADHTYICPRSFHYQKMGMWRKYTHNGFLYIYCPKEEETEMILSKVREMETEHMLFGATRCYKGIGIRVLAHQGDRVFRSFQKIADEI